MHTPTIATEIETTEENLKLILKKEKEQHFLNELLDETKLYLISCYLQSQCFILRRPASFITYGND